MLFNVITNLILVMYKYNIFIGGCQGLFFLRRNHSPQGRRTQREEDIGKKSSIIRNGLTADI